MAVILFFRRNVMASLLEVSRKNELSSPGHIDQNLSTEKTATSMVLIHRGQEIKFSNPNSNF
jgi:hypothetical protein